MAGFSSPLGSDFQMMGAPMVTVDQGQAPGYPSVTAAANASYGASFGAVGSPLLWFLIILGAGLLMYHWDVR